MSLVVSFAQVLRLWRKQCQPKHSSSATSPRAIADGLTNLAFMVCPHNGLLPSRVGEAYTKSSSLLYSVSWRNSLFPLAAGFFWLRFLPGRLLQLGGELVRQVLSTLILHRPPRRRLDKTNNAVLNWRNSAPCSRPCHIELRLFKAG